MRTEFHILNLGAGVQSTFLYLQFLRGLITPQIDAAIFADTQEEPAAVYSHLQWLISLKGPKIFIRTVGKLGDDLVHGRNSTGQRFTAIPAFTTDGDTVGITRRQCSKEYKTEVIGQAIRRDILNLSPGQPVPRGIVVHQYFGISLNESGRAARISARRHPKYLHFHFPLVERFIVRSQCEVWLRTVVPHEVPRSACVFCPFHSDAEWEKIKAVPQDWRRAVEVDAALRTTGSCANRDKRQTMYVHRSCRPLPLVKLEPKTDPRANQSNINFAPECLGVCGL